MVVGQTPASHPRTRCMRRIGLAVILAVGFVLAPLAVNAQPADRVYRIGMLERTSPAINAANLEGFRHGLRRWGTPRGRTLSSSTDQPMAATSGFRAWRPSAREASALKSTMRYELRTRPH